jgi:integrase
MPKQATGEVRFSGGIWRARITLKGRERADIPLPNCHTEAEAKDRALLLTEQAKHLRLAGKAEHAGALPMLEELGKAPASGLADAIEVIGVLCGASTMPARLEGPSFADVAKQWTGGELARDWPDHVNVKDNTPDERRLKTISALDVGGLKFGDIPVSRLTIEHVEGVMRQLPAGAKRPATRRHYAQVIARVLGLAVYPLRLIKVSPLPKGFLPKVGKPPAFSYLYPAEDAALMACKEVPVEERLLFGFLAREGMRVSEAASLLWKEVDLKIGSVSLDQNKTDDARTWKLDPGVTRALAVLHERTKPAGETLVFPAPGGVPFDDANKDRLAEVLRDRLEEAGVNRAELIEDGVNRRRLRVHDLRGTFVTLNLAAGKSESWVKARTGHTSSIMIARYDRAARTAKELALGELKPLDAAIPELAAIAHALPMRPAIVALKSFRRGSRSSRIRLGGPCRTRTGTPLLERDFKSPASAVPPRGHVRSGIALTRGRREPSSRCSER